MHPFCCVSTVSDHSPAKTSASALTELAMPQVTSPSSRSDSSGRLVNHFGNHNHNHSQSYSQNHNNNHNHNQSQNSHIGNNDYGRLSQRTTAAAAAAAAAAMAAAEALSRPPSAREQPLDVKINDLVGNGVSGILYKWVNYGKGWRPRWFVLQDGVLSYYKIHGPDRIVVSQETEKGSKVIGEESNRRISRQKNGSTSHNQHRRKPFGEIHLKVPLWFLFEFLYPFSSSDNLISDCPVSICMEKISLSNFVI